MSVGTIHAVRAAWAASLYLVTFLLLVAYALGPRGPTIVRRLDRWVRGAGLRAILCVTAIQAVAMIAFHLTALTLHPSAAERRALYDDQSTYFEPAARRLLAGENPWAGEFVAMHHSILFHLVNGFLHMLGGIHATVAWWTLVDYALVPVAYLVARTRLREPRDAGYVAMFLLFLPIGVNLNAATAQEEGGVALSLLLPLLLLERGRIVAAGALAGLLAHVKILTFFLFLPVLALQATPRMGAPRDWGRAMLGALSAGATFALLAGAAMFRYGAAYVQGVFGLLEPVGRRTLLGVHSFTWVDFMAEVPRARAALMVVLGAAMLVYFAYALCFARCNDPIAATTVSLTAFYLFAYFCLEKYVLWSLPLVFPLLLSRWRWKAAAWLVGASVVLHAWAWSVWGFPDVPGQRPVATLVTTALVATLGVVALGCMRARRCAAGAADPFPARRGTASSPSLRL